MLARGHVRARVCACAVCLCVTEEPHLGLRVSGVPSRHALTSLVGDSLLPPSLKILAPEPRLTAFPRLRPWLPREQLPAILTPCPFLVASSLR